MRALWVAGALAGLLIATTGMAGERLTVEGTGISMEVPDGFVPAPNFSGFTNPETNSAIIFDHIDAAVYARFAAAFVSVEAANAALAVQGIAVSEMTLLPTLDGDALTVVHGIKTQGDVTVELWLALSGPDDARIVSINLLGGDDPDADAVRAALQSLTFGGPLSIEEEMAALPFAISTQPPFVVQEAFGGAIVWLRTVEEDPTGLLPVVMLTWTLSWNEPLANAAEIAEPMLRDTAGMENAVIEERDPASFAGRDGIRLAGSYQRYGAVPMTFVQYVAVVDGQTVRLLATMIADDTAAVTPVVDQIARTVIKR